MGKTRKVPKLKPSTSLASESIKLHVSVNLVKTGHYLPTQYGMYKDKYCSYQMINIAQRSKFIARNTILKIHLHLIMKKPFIFP